MSIKETIVTLIADWIAGPPGYAIGSLASGSATEVANEARWKARIRARAWGLRSEEEDRRAVAVLDLIIRDVTEEELHRVTRQPGGCAV